MPELKPIRASCEIPHLEDRLSHVSPALLRMERGQVAGSLFWIAPDYLKSVSANDPT